MSAVPDPAAELVSLWFGPLDEHGRPHPDHRARWFGGGEAFDEELRTRFGDAVEAALAGQLDAWAGTPEGRLALVLLLDQLPRNLFRGRAKSFAGDAAALRFGLAGLDGADAQRLSPAHAVFLVMPLMHAEDLALQERCIGEFENLAERASPALRENLAGNIDFARRHRDVIARFGRFPHRNAVLGRSSTQEEERYLAEGGGF